MLTLLKIELKDPLLHLMLAFQAAAKQSDDELPTMGIVSRLKGWFGGGQVDTKPLSHRSKSSDDLLKIGALL